MTLEEAVSIAGSVSADFGLGEDVGNAGTPVAITSSVDLDAKTPFAISLALPSGDGAALTGDLSLLVVMYKVKVAAEGKVVVGIIPPSELDTSSGKVKVLVSHFGVYQAAFMKKPVSERKEDVASTPILTKKDAGALPTLVLTGRTPFVAKPGETVVLEGKNFRPSMTLALGGKKLASTVVASDVQASFVAPAATGFGSAQLTAEQDGMSQKITLFFQGATDFPVSTKPEGEICAGEKFYNAAGELKVGTRNCAGPDLSALTAENLKTGVTVAGVTGTLTPAPANCASDGAVGCVTTAAFKAANVGTIDPWDLRIGRSLGGVTGQLKIHCRNGVGRDSGGINFVFNYDGDLASLPDARTYGGTALDYWDTSDDGYGLPTALVSGWTQATNCDASNFADVSTINGGTNTITCSPSTCIHKDRVTNLLFTAPLSDLDPNVTDLADDATMDWDSAIRACHNSTSGGYAAGFWRVPTQKELMSIYEHGVAALAGTNFGNLVPNLNANFWTSTHNGSNTDNAWKVWLANGDTDNTSPRSDPNHKVLCVH